MGYKSLAACVRDLERSGRLFRITAEIDPHLEMAEIQRRVYAAGGPALLFERVRGSRFPAVSNLYGTLERARYIFRRELRGVQALIGLKADPTSALRAPLNGLRAFRAALNALPLPGLARPAMYAQCRISDLPQIVSWPRDGGAFITLPQVYSDNPEKPGPLQSNLGMYRIQLAGNDYVRDREIGLHYQIHRGIGVHHAASIARGEPFRVSVFVGGPPAHAFAAVMPLPEGLPELAFAGALAGRNFRYARDARGSLVSLDADFVITGVVASELKPEGPFGDHLGYYSLAHDFPVLRVETVYHRKDAIWPFTVVGRPPQEDTVFGQLIHELASPMAPVSIPGLRAMHAVDAAGVHPLLLAIGSERYTPYNPARRPMEILTIANAVLGFNQASLAKYLMIVAGEDAPDLDLHHIDEFFAHLLERIDFTRDLHFQTRTTIDTLDYSGTGLNEGSKLVLAAAGPPRRTLARELPAGLRLASSFRDPRLALPGVVVVSGPRHTRATAAEREMRRLAAQLAGQAARLKSLPLFVVCDDAEFSARTLNNFLWTAFTRSNPSHDVYGAGEFTEHKHWGCTGPLLIDARRKPFHAPPLVEDPAVTRRVDQLAAPGGPLHGLF